LQRISEFRRNDRKAPLTAPGPSNTPVCGALSVAG
jgi:hypothetical protein